MQKFFIYGAPGSGKSTLGQAVAHHLALPFHDLDAVIEQEQGCAVREIFAASGEAAFRTLEQQTLQRLATAPSEAVIALGGGALLDPASHALAAAHGTILLLDTPLAILEQRTHQAPGSRPLLTGAHSTATALAALLAQREAHYRSFPLRIDGSSDDLTAKVAAAAAAFGAFRISGMGSVATTVRVGSNLLSSLGRRLTADGWQGHALIVADSNTVLPYGEVVRDSLQQAGCRAQLVTIPAGESEKNITTLTTLWQACLAAGIDRGGTLVAVGGGVVGDLVGFAAATWMRGVRWVGIPTTLLAMVDSSLGGKTAIDLPAGKNLVGAFHPPTLVVADNTTLATLPEGELRSGAAEAIKHGVISDPQLFADFEAATAPWQAADWRVPRLAQAMAVKVAIITADPYERGIRAALNLGHTLGHGIELASHFALRHGEAVAIGMVAEARLAEQLGLAHEPGLSRRLQQVLAAHGLPTTLPPGISLEDIGQAMLHDKKNEAGTLRFALPCAIGEVHTRVTATPQAALAALKA